jgi:hypothetical protein
LQPTQGRTLILVSTCAFWSVSPSFDGRYLMTRGLVVPGSMFVLSQSMENPSLTAAGLRASMINSPGCPCGRILVIIQERGRAKYLAFRCNCIADDELMHRRVRAAIMLQDNFNDFGRRGLGIGTRVVVGHHPLLDSRVQSPWALLLCRSRRCRWRQNVHSPVPCAASFDADGMLDPLRIACHNW